MKQHLQSLIMLLMVAFISGACTVAVEEVSPIEYNDLIGKWTADYSQYSDSLSLPKGGKETLVLRKDGSFEQHFEKSMGIPFQENISGKWSIERIDDEWIRIYLNGAMYYLEGISAAKDPTFGIAAWDPILGRHVSIGNRSGIVILYATRLSSDSEYNSRIPCGKKNEVVLQHLPIGDLDAPTWVIFCRR